MVSLQTLDDGIRTCTACPLAHSRTHAVPGAGPAPTTIMLVGEAPGREEDRLGLPFIGRSGKLLDKILEDVGWSRTTLYITSAVKCRPPQNRIPTRAELETCRNLWLVRQIAILQPNIIVCLGGVSARTLIGPVDLREQHGTFIQRGDQRFFLTYHPAAALRFPVVRAAMVTDFRGLDKFLRRGQS